MEDKYVLQKGHLDVGDGHQIYYEEWGNKKAPPIIHLHGGPGAGFSSSHKRIYNPTKHHVIFHDQRGAGKSTPYASTKNNTTQDLINDIQKLRTYLNIKGPAYVVGGSWGSTLAMVYTIAHPTLVKRLLMWGIYLNRKEEIDYLYQGGPRTHFPEAWRRFIELVGANQRKSSMDVIKFYFEKFNSSDKEKAVMYANEWTLWEATVCALNYDPQKLEEGVFKEDNLAIANLEAHYFLHDCFISHSYILDNIKKIAHIPATVVQGRYDFCTPPSAAFDLKNAYGDTMSLHMVNNGHLRSEPETLASLRIYTEAVLA